MVRISGVCSAAPSPPSPLFLLQYVYGIAYPENFFSTLCIIVVLFVVVPWLHVLKIHGLRSFIIQPGFDGL